ncbi:MAG: hypothetical protein M1834_001538 [Cirrosporium novae-zelandiae]|nr:MAG: hypothetical protein M1834_004055 [Cirrosporium novae-zelandiae]KAI9735523.1 MAG: hypothetical protein M1834_001538 [Cirrosporium novae-zelandiae]
MLEPISFLLAAGLVAAQTTTTTVDNGYGPVGAGPIDLSVDPVNSDIVIEVGQFSTTLYWSTIFTNGMSSTSPSTTSLSTTSSSSTPSSSTPSSTPCDTSTLTVVSTTTSLATTTSVSTATETDISTATETDISTTTETDVSTTTATDVSTTTTTDFSTATSVSTTTDISMETFFSSVAPVATSGSNSVSTTTDVSTLTDTTTATTTATTTDITTTTSVATTQVVSTALAGGNLPRSQPTSFKAKRDPAILGNTPNNAQASPSSFWTWQLYPAPGHWELADRFMLPSDRVPQPPQAPFPPPFGMEWVWHPEFGCWALERTFGPPGSQYPVRDYKHIPYPAPPGYAWTWRNSYWEVVQVYAPNSNQPPPGSSLPPPPKSPFGYPTGWPWDVPPQSPEEQFGSPNADNPQWDYEGNLKFNWGGKEVEVSAGPSGDVKIDNDRVLRGAAKQQDGEGAPTYDIKRLMSHIKPILSYNVNMGFAKRDILGKRSAGMDNELSTVYSIIYSTVTDSCSAKTDSPRYTSSSAPHPSINSSNCTSYPSTTPPVQTPIYYSASGSEAQSSFATGTGSGNYNTSYQGPVSNGGFSTVVPTWTGCLLGSILTFFSLG